MHRQEKLVAASAWEYNNRGKPEPTTKAAFTSNTRD